MFTISSLFPVVTQKSLWFWSV